MIFILQFLKFDWEKNAKVIFIFSSCIISFILYLMTYLKNIFVDYVGYLYITSSYYILVAVSGFDFFKYFNM